MYYEALAVELAASLRGRGHSFEAFDVISHGEDSILIYMLTVSGGILPGDISRSMGLSTGRIAICLKDLEKKGYISRRPDDADGRKIWVTLTEYGREKGEEIRNRMMTRVISLLRTLGPDDAKDFVRIVRRINENYDRITDAASRQE